MNFIVRKFATLAPFVGCSLLACLLCLISLSAHALVPLVVVSGCEGAPSIPGRYIVRAQTSGALRTQSLSLVEQLISENPTRLIHRSVTPTVVALRESSVDKSVVTVASELSEDQLSALSTDATTLSIEQDCLVRVDAIPNDPVESQYVFGRDVLNLAKAWDVKTDSSNVTVAVSDTGVDYKHEDLAANIWTNKAELNGLPGVDDDGNGCIDDVHGCDFGDYDGDPMPFTSSEGDHGTHVSGIIGAVGNNSVGVTGVSWTAQLMAVKGFDSVGNARVSDLLNTIYYAVNNGARVINCSWGANRAPTQAETDAFQFALSNGVLPVVAAGNASADAAGFSPAAIDGVLTVGSVNSLDQVSGFSNFGSHVLVYAPGGDAKGVGGATTDEFVTSTIPTNHGSYGTMRGTSMAAPFVTGIAALVFAVNPKLSAVDVRNIIVASARHVTSKLPNGTSTDIAIPDALAALTKAATYVATPFTTTPAPTSKPSSAMSAQPVQGGTPSYDAAGSCALKRDAHSNWSGLIFLLLPLAAAFVLRKPSRRRLHVIA